jgi:transposase
VGIDATTLEANAAMRSIVRRDTGEKYDKFLTRLAQESGIRTPSRAALARLDRRRRNKTSNKDWTSPSDPDAKVTKMKDGRTHLAHKAEHAVDLDSGALISVTIHGADEGDTATMAETLAEAEAQLDAVIERAPEDVDPDAPAEVVADKGYHSDATLLEIETGGLRSYISEPERGRRKWKDDIDARIAVYSNRRRIRGDRGKRLQSMRGERIERSFAHLYETGGMRRTHLRGHDNIRKRVLLHASAFNLGLLLRTMFGRGTPRGLQGLLLLISVLTTAVHDVLDAAAALWIPSAGSPARRPELLTHGLVTA